MADSTTPKPTPAKQSPTVAALPATLALAHFKPALPFAVALSGGADSTALLLACALRWPQQVRAVHVHHGLQAAAEGFVTHCETLCEQLRVPLVIERINAAHASGESPEEAARRGRYLAIARALQTHWGGTVRELALAQHADDQVETMLLALSRGAGLPGLSAMPEKIDRHGLVLHRPWLNAAGADIRQWLRDSGVPWVEDPTNLNEQFTRNRIRQRLLPALQDAFPSFRHTFARSARHAAQAQQLLNTLAQQDLQTAGDPPRLTALQALDEARQVNLLRFWLNNHEVQASAAQIDALLVQIRACTTRGHRIDIKVGNGYVRREGECLHWYNQKL
jgi:tRNA(Ile)-lysidine synthase